MCGPRTQEQTRVGAGRACWGCSIGRPPDNPVPQEAGQPGKAGRIQRIHWRRWDSCSSHQRIPSCLRYLPVCIRLGCRHNSMSLAPCILLLHMPENLIRDSDFKAAGASKLRHLGPQEEGRSHSHWMTHRFRVWVMVFCLMAFRT